tara:strand:- start:384 stop:608 length:225 start_codon:yes stop_codon:yes gene_type:complete
LARGALTVGALAVGAIARAGIAGCRGHFLFVVHVFVVVLTFRFDNAQEGRFLLLSTTRDKKNNADADYSCVPYE